jgi:Zinc carboxypeptidase
MRALRAAVLAVGGLLIVAVPAGAAGSRSVSASKAVPRACHQGLVDSKSGKRTRVKSRVSGLMRVRLRGGRGDWDLAVFGKRGRTVAGSAGRGSRELAEGFVRKGERLTIQACRLRGGAASARWSWRIIPVKAGKREKVQIVDVTTRTRPDKQRLQSLGLDLTEHGDANSVEVVLHGKADARTLRAAGFKWKVRIADLAARSRQNARADRAYAARAASRGSKLPSGRTSYRHLWDYEYEMKKLARRYRHLVKPITLNHRTIEGRDVNGIEITTNPRNVADGKPVFLMMGVHHAREWPSSEHTIEFAYDLLKKYRTSRRVRRQLQSTRVIIVPIVNADGFNISREAAPLGDFSLFDYEMKRKNCRISENTPEQYRTGPCDDNPAGRLRGTDPNRNYGGLWGGGGASTNWSDDTYRGDAPFSEPEIQNIHELAQNRQVTNLITNHTYSNLVLRPPGIAAVGFPHEEPLMRELGGRMTSHNRYRNIPGFMLYDTSGGTEDWSFWTQGGLGYTFEIGPSEFHPPYETGVVAEYLGREPAAGAGLGGNRAAYYEMLDSTADDSHHSVITGKAPRGSKLRVHKEFLTDTSPVWQDDTGENIGDPIRFPDYLQSDLRTRGGRFEWHVNPSTRPIVAGRYGREPTGPPQATIPLANPPGIPGENQDYPVPPDEPNERIPFTVQGPDQGVDNGKMTVHIEWTNPAVDWDIYVWNTDTGELATSSASFGDTDEDAILFDPPPGNYEAVVINWDGGDTDDWVSAEVQFASPTPATTGEEESWTLSCVGRNGQLQGTQQVVVARGQRVDAGDVCSSRKRSR